MITTDRCPACERGSIAPRKSIPVGVFRHLSKLPAAWEVEIPTCDTCGEEFIDRKVAAALDEAFEASLGELRKQMVESSLARMTEVLPQREWEHRLGLSPGYLSRLKGGKESSVALVTLLGIIGLAPRAWSEKIEALWLNGGTLPAAPILRPVVWSGSEQEWAVKPVRPSAVTSPTTSTTIPRDAFVEEAVAA